MLANPIISNADVFISRSRSAIALGFGTMDAANWQIMSVGWMVPNFHDEEARQYTFHLFGENGDEDYEGEIPTLP